MKCREIAGSSTCVLFLFVICFVILFVFQTCVVYLYICMKCMSCSIFVGQMYIMIFACKIIDHF